MRFSSCRNRRGFTLVELLVVMTIAIILLTAMVFQQNRWNDRLSVNTQAYELSLMLRQAQIYGLGVMQSQTSLNGDKFSSGYGIHINLVTPGVYYFFADDDNDMQFDSNELIETKNLTRGVRISRICGFNPGNLYVCSPSASISRTNITFIRPEPKANSVLINPSGIILPNYRAPIDIFLISPNGYENRVRVDQNGFISVTQ